MERVLEVDDVGGRGGGALEPGGHEHPDRQRRCACEPPACDQEPATPEDEKDASAREEHAAHREVRDEDETGQDRAQHAAQGGDAVDLADSTPEEGDLAGHQADGDGPGHAEEHERRCEEECRAHQRPRLEAERCGGGEHTAPHPGEEEQTERSPDHLEREARQARPAVGSPSAEDGAGAQRSERHADQRRPHVDARAVVWTDDARPHDLHHQDDRADQEGGEEHVGVLQDRPGRWKRRRLPTISHRGVQARRARGEGTASVKKMPEPTGPTTVRQVARRADLRAYPRASCAAIRSRATRTRSPARQSGRGVRGLAAGERIFYASRCENRHPRARPWHA